MPPSFDSSRFTIRPATLEDAPAMAEVWFNSFNSSFWKYFVPDVPRSRHFMEETFRMGIRQPSTSEQTFVAIDTAEKEDKIVAWSRWVLPQSDGTLGRECSWYAGKEGEEHHDPELQEAFFGGMFLNRSSMMGTKPHWMLELLGTHQDYEGQGIGAKLMEWGTTKADEGGYDVYLDGSAAGQGYYEKKFGFKPIRKIEVPDRKEFGSYEYISMVRPAQQKE